MATRKGHSHDPSFTCFQCNTEISTVVNIKHATAMPIMFPPLQRANHSVCNTPHPSRLLDLLHPRQRRYPGRSACGSERSRPWRSHREMCVQAWVDAYEPV